MKTTAALAAFLVLGACSSYAAEKAKPHISCTTGTTPLLGAWIKFKTTQGSLHKDVTYYPDNDRYTSDSYKKCNQRVLRRNYLTLKNVYVTQEQEEKKTKLIGKR